MIAIIRISGMVQNSKGITNTLDRLRLRRKYACVVLKDSAELKGMLKKVRNDVAYGNINEETLLELVKARGQSLDKTEINAKEIVEKIFKNENFEGTGIKPFFRLHPAIGGIKSSKMHFPKGVLGNHKEKINDLIRRML